MVQAGCSSPTPATAPCPIDVEALAQATRASLPPGWAWDSAGVLGTVMHALTVAWAQTIHMVGARACELLPEFVCHTVDETRPEWDADYGLPDDCGINDLCAKVAATGGANCAYFTELAALLGDDICCQELPPEIQAGCWNLGCDEMPPRPTFLKGGFDLGVAGLGVCTDPDGGSYLGEDVIEGDCYVSGWRERAPAVTTPPNPCDLKAREWWPKSATTFVVGCHEPVEMQEYTGTAYHWIVGLSTDRAVIGDFGTCDPHPGTGTTEWELGQTPFGTYVPPAVPFTSPYAMIGCMEIGCSAQCTPIPPPSLCFIETLRPAHVVPLRRYCDNL